MITITLNAAAIGKLSVAGRTHFVDVPAGARLQAIPGFNGQYWADPRDVRMHDWLKFDAEYRGVVVHATPDQITVNR